MTERKERTKLKWILWRCIARIGGGWNWHRLMSRYSLCCEQCWACGFCSQGVR